MQQDQAKTKPPTVIKSNKQNNTSNVNLPRQQYQMSQTDQFQNFQPQQANKSKFRRDNQKPEYQQQIEKKLQANEQNLLQEDQDNLITRHKQNMNDLEQQLNKLLLSKSGDFTDKEQKNTKEKIDSQSFVIESSQQPQKQQFYSQQFSSYKSAKTFDLEQKTQEESTKQDYKFSDKYEQQQQSFDFNLKKSYEEQEREQEQDSFEQKDMEHIRRIINEATSYSSQQHSPKESENYPPIVSYQTETNINTSNKQKTNPRNFSQQEQSFEGPTKPLYHSPMRMASPKRPGKELGVKKSQEIHRIANIMKGDRKESKNK